MGLRLLSGVKPSEIFLKSVSNEVTNVDIVFPSRFVSFFFRVSCDHILLSEKFVGQFNKTISHICMV